MCKTFHSKLNQKLQKQVNYLNIYLHIILLFVIISGFRSKFELSFAGIPPPKGG